MIPTSVATLIAFLVFVAPGAAYEEVAQIRRAHLRSTTFREINRVALVSVGAWFTPAVVLAVLSLAWNMPIRVLAGEEHWVRQPTAVVALLLHAAVAVGLAAGAARWVTRNESGNLIEATGWHVIFSKLRYAHDQYLWVTLASGEVWGGFYSGADLRDVGRDQRDLVLMGDIQLRYRESAEPKPVTTDMVALNGADIRAVLATNRPKGAREEAIARAEAMLRT